MTRFGAANNLPMMRKSLLRSVETVFCLGFSLLFSACSSPAARACEKLAVLCSVGLSKEDRRDCVEAFDAASQETKSDVGKRFLQCTSIANSCAEAVVCASEGGTRLLTNLTNQFLDGFERGRRGKPDERSAIRYISVAAHPLVDFLGIHLFVSLAIEVPSTMPRGAAYVTVNARCGVQTDTRDAFFSDLSDAGKDRRVGRIKLFRSGLTGPVERCELTLRFAEGMTPPARFCMQQGTTTPGRCP